MGDKLDGMSKLRTEELFLLGARTVLAALEDVAVVSAWDKPSVLEGQLVSGLAGHLARGGVWVVGDYLDAGSPSGVVDFVSAAAYFAAFAELAGDAIHERGATVAAVGQPKLVAVLRERIEGLQETLPSLPAGHLVSVIAGRVMYLEDYLVTRIVEQSVHLDDLARSIGYEVSPWPLPDDHVACAISAGFDIAIQRAGTTAVLRALYRQGFAAGALPVL
jgi:hypothetical protein